MCSTVNYRSIDRRGSRRIVRSRILLSFAAALLTRNRMMDVSFFVLTVDLWDNEAQNELNLIAYPYSSQTSQSSQPGAQNYFNSDTFTVENDASGHADSCKMPEYQSSGARAPSNHFTHDSTLQNYQQSQRTPSQPTSGTYTRNLIGSLVASASKLKDTNERLGIWFVLQDLSVRTEGCMYHSYLTMITLT